MITKPGELSALITPVRKELYGRAFARLDSLTKPRGSLGRLEETAARLYAIAGGAERLEVSPACLFLSGGDHGVWDEGVSPHPQEVTHQMLLNILGGGAASSVLAGTCGMDILVIDAGHLGGRIQDAGLVTIGEEPCTGNIMKEAALDRGLCGRLIAKSADIVLERARAGLKLAAIGEMGIANTTPATALFCAYLGLDPAKITGPGTGLSADGVRHKISVIRKALETHAETVRSGDALAILAALGGFEIASMAGTVLGAAAARIPVLIDGFIATAAYTAARALVPAAADCAFLCTRSAEPGYQAVQEALGEKALLDLGLRLGEGTGCAAAYPLFRAAAAVFNDMASFSSAGVTEEKIF